MAKKLTIPTKTDGVSELSADEVNKIVQAHNESVDDINDLKDNETELDGGGA